MGYNTLSLATVRLTGLSVVGLGLCRCYRTFTARFSLSRFFFLFGWVFFYPFLQKLTDNS
jgi:hypothetical protein